MVHQGKLVDGHPKRKKFGKGLGEAALKEARRQRGNVRQDGEKRQSGRRAKRGPMREPAVYWACGGQSRTKTMAGGLGARSHARAVVPACRRKRMIFCASEWPMGGLNGAPSARLLS